MAVVGCQSLIANFVSFLSLEQKILCGKVIVVGYNMMLRVVHGS